MNTSTNADRLLSPDLRVTRRGIAAATLVGTLAAGGAAVVGNKIVDAGKDAVNTVSSNIHQADESSKFEHVLGNTLSSDSIQHGLKSEGIKPTDVTLHTISATEGTPTEVARDMGAKDPTLVAEEISGQVGGDRSMQSGEIVAIPNDQLKTGSN